MRATSFVPLTLGVTDDQPPRSDSHLLRAPGRAAWARLALGIAGVALLITRNAELEHPLLGIVGFCAIVATALMRMGSVTSRWVLLEELLAGSAAVMIVGLQAETFTAASALWLAAAACGIMARVGLMLWPARLLVLAALALPAIRHGHLAAGYLALCMTVAALLPSIGWLMRELNQLRQQARYDADHDDLTGLLARAAFRAQLERAIEQSSAGSPVSLLLLDLERFRLVNKLLGHATADLLLADVGERIREVAGPARPAGRLGGDEFAIMLDGSDALPLGRALLEAMPTYGEDDQRQISASIGVARTPKDGESTEALLRAADIALRIAKRSGVGGQIYVYSGESLSGTGERSARYVLTRLIEGKGLSIHVQPILDLRSGAVHAYEALARFGRRSTDSPLHWLSIAEEFGEREALEQACLKKALELFPIRPAGTRLSVNLSAPVLLNEDTRELLQRMPKLSDLIIEVTEDALAQSDTELQPAIAPLRDRGVLLAVDDMGAGYSGLRQIITVHPAYLKIDRSLISAIDKDGDRQALVGALVSYANHVGTLVVAEGIETQAELKALTELGVPLGQGFYLCRPSTPWPKVDISDCLPELSATPLASRPNRHRRAPTQSGNGNRQRRAWS